MIDEEMFEKLKRNINTRVNLEETLDDIDNAKRGNIMLFEFIDEIIFECI